MLDGQFGGFDPHGRWVAECLVADVAESLSNQNHTQKIPHQIMGPLIFQNLKTRDNQ